MGLAHAAGLDVRPNVPWRFSRLENFRLDFVIRMSVSVSLMAIAFPE